jgi:hypothetical protein
MLGLQNLKPSNRGKVVLSNKTNSVSVINVIQYLNMYDIYRNYLIKNKAELCKLVTCIILETNVNYWQLIQCTSS